jgi:hypothetical protein
LRELGLDTLQDRLRARERLLRSRGIILRAIHIDERCLPPGSFVERLTGFGRLRMVLHVVLVHLSLFLRTLRRALPLAAQFVVHLGVRGQRSPLGAGKLFADLIHEFGRDAAAEIRVALAGGATAHHVGLVDLPVDIGRAPEGLPGERRFREVLVGAVVETQRIFVGTLAAATPGGLVLGIDGFTEEDAVAVRSRVTDKSFFQDPASHIAGLPDLGENLHEVLALIDDGDFTPARNVAELRGSGVRRDVERRLAHQHAALGLRGGERGKDDRKEQGLEQSHE